MNAVITRYAETPIILGSGRSSHDLAGEAFALLLARSGIAKSEIDGFSGTAALSEASNPFHVAHMTEVLGLQLDWLHHAVVGGASMLSGVAAAAAAIDRGQCRIAVVLGADAPSTRNYANPCVYRKEFVEPVGMLRPLGPFGLLQNAYAQRHGDPTNALAHIVLSQRRNAAFNDNACSKLKVPLSRDDYLSSRMIADPVRVLDSVMFCDGANAVLMMAEDEAARRGLDKVVRVAGYAERSHHLATVPTADPLRTGFEAVGQAAMLQAGVEPCDIDILQLYDDFSIAVLLQLEQCGFCQEGGAANFMLSKDISPGGNVPINTGGGQLSSGQPGLAGGGIPIVEAVRQMFGHGGGRQAARTRNCLVTGIGGIAYGRNWMMSNAMVLCR